jgi:putative tricarboxylic transport membrane protein
MGDRIFGLVTVLGALAYIAGAFQIQTSFLIDPVGSKTFPIIIGCLMVICGVIMLLRPDADTDWPGTLGVLGLALSLVVLVSYAFSLRPLGFLMPTAVASAVLSYQIVPNPRNAVLTGLGLSVGLFVLFYYGLGLTNIAPLPNAWKG